MTWGKHKRWAGVWFKRSGSPRIERVSQLLNGLQIARLASEEIHDLDRRPESRERINPPVGEISLFANLGYQIPLVAGRSNKCWRG